MTACSEARRRQVLSCERDLAVSRRVGEKGRKTENGWLKFGIRARAKLCCDTSITFNFAFPLPALIFYARASISLLTSPTCSSSSPSTPLGILLAAKAAKRILRLNV